LPPAPGSPGDGAGGGGPASSPGGSPQDSGGGAGAGYAGGQPATPFGLVGPIRLLRGAAEPCLLPVPPAGTPGGAAGTIYSAPRGHGEGLGAVKRVAPGGGAAGQGGAAGPAGGGAPPAEGAGPAGGLSGAGPGSGTCGAQSRTRTRSRWGRKRQTEAGGTSVCAGAFPGLAEAGPVGRDRLPVDEGPKGEPSGAAYRLGKTTVSPTTGKEVASLALRVGVVGVGSMGKNHARIYAQMPGRVKLVGVA